MDDKLIIDFINNIEPNMSYGSSDDISRAMVESAENMALINDYIVESTYEVYTEAEDKQGFFNKVQAKVSTYMTLFVNLIKKFIAKIKGFFFTLKRKLTVAMAKALKAIGNFVKNHISDLSSEKEVEVYKWSPYAANLATFIGDIGIDIFNKDKMTSEQAKKRIEELKQQLAEFLKNYDILDLEKKTISKKDAEKFFKDCFSVDINKKMDTWYDSIMDTSKRMIDNLSKIEKGVINDLKKTPNMEEFKKVKDKLKGVNILINGLNSIKYTIAQKMASSIMKYCKKLFSAIKSVIGGSKSVDEKKEPSTKQESAYIIDMIK